MPSRENKREKWPRSHVYPVGVLTDGSALCAVW